MSSIPFALSISPDPALIVFSGRNTDPVEFAITNDDDRAITSLKINVVRADLMPVDSIPGESEKLKLAAGQELIEDFWGKARQSDLDPWTDLDDWTNHLELGPMSPGQTKTFKFKLEIPDELSREADQGFALMISAI